MDETLIHVHRTCIIPLGMYMSWLFVMFVMSCQMYMYMYNVQCKCTLFLYCSTTAAAAADCCLGMRGRSIM